MKTDSNSTSRNNTPHTTDTQEEKHDSQSERIIPKEQPKKPNIPGTSAIANEHRQKQSSTAVTVNSSIDNEKNRTTKNILTGAVTSSNGNEAASTTSSTTTSMKTSGRISALEELKEKVPLEGQVEEGLPNKIFKISALLHQETPRTRNTSVVATSNHRSAQQSTLTPPSKRTNFAATSTTTTTATNATSTPSSSQRKGLRSLSTISEEASSSLRSGPTTANTSQNKSSVRRLQRHDSIHSFRSATSTSHQSFTSQSSALSQLSDPQSRFYQSCVYLPLPDQLNTSFSKYLKTIEEEVAAEAKEEEAKHDRGDGGHDDDDQGLLVIDQEGFHRDFCHAVWNIGVQHATPSVLYYGMQAAANVNSTLTMDRVKSHLQKYRQYKSTEEERFLHDYDQFLGYLQEIDSRRHVDGEVHLLRLESLVGAKAAAHATHSLILEAKATAARRKRNRKRKQVDEEGKEQKMQHAKEEEGKGQEAADNESEVSSHGPIVQEYSMLDQVYTRVLTPEGYGAGRLFLPKMTDDEAVSSLGVSIKLVHGLLQHMNDHLSEERAKTQARLQSILQKQKDANQELLQKEQEEYQRRLRERFPGASLGAATGLASLASSLRGLQQGTVFGMGPPPIRPVPMSSTVASASGYSYSSSNTTLPSLATMIPLQQATALTNIVPDQGPNTQVAIGTSSIPLSNRTLEQSKSETRGSRHLASKTRRILNENDDASSSSDEDGSLLLPSSSREDHEGDAFSSLLRDLGLHEDELSHLFDVNTHSSSKKVSSNSEIQPHAENPRISRKRSRRKGPQTRDEHTERLQQQTQLANKVLLEFEESAIHSLELDGIKLNHAPKARTAALANAQPPSQQLPPSEPKAHPMSSKWSSSLNTSSVEASIMNSEGLGISGFSGLSGLSSSNNNSSRGTQKKSSSATSSSFGFRPASASLVDASQGGGLYSRQSDNRTQSPSQQRLEAALAPTNTTDRNMTLPPLVYGTANDPSSDNSIMKFLEATLHQGANTNESSLQANPNPISTMMPMSLNQSSSNRNNPQSVASLLSGARGIFWDDSSIESDEDLPTNETRPKPMPRTEEAIHDYVGEMVKLDSTLKESRRLEDVQDTKASLSLSSTNLLALSNTEGAVDTLGFLADQQKKPKATSKDIQSLASDESTDSEGGEGIAATSRKYYQNIVGSLLDDDLISLRGGERASARPIHGDAPFMVLDKTSLGPRQLVDAGTADTTRRMINMNEDSTTQDKQEQVPTQSDISTMSFQELMTTLFPESK